LKLDERLVIDPNLRDAFYDLGRSNREVGKKFDIDESIIRRGRARHLSAPGHPGVVPLVNIAGTEQVIHGVDMTPPDPPKVRDEEIERMLARYVFHPVKRTPTHQGKIFVTPIGDLQAGKIDGGGTAALVDRFGQAVEQMRDRLVQAGGCKTLIIPVLGDCIEGYVFLSGRNVTRLDLSITEQVRIYRRLLTHIIATLAAYADDVVVIALPGNHDETWRQSSTPVVDSWAIEGASAVEDAFAMSEYDNIKFVYPRAEELVVTLNVGTASNPYVLAFTHGHLVNSPNKVVDWWSGQSFGRQHGGGANILFSAHYHHLRVEQMSGGRTWIQIPAFDGGSDWYRRETGANSDPGAISMWITPHQGIGWEGLTVHKGVTAK
jgi:hypothetical protein